MKGIKAIKISADELGLFFLLFFSALIQYISAAGNNILAFIDLHFELVSWQILFASSIAIFIILKKKILPASVLITFAVILSVLLANWLIYGNKQITNDRVINLIFLCFPYFVIGSISHIPEKVDFTKIRNIALFVLLINAFYIIFRLSANPLLNENMYFSYSILSPALIVVYCAIFDSKTVNTVFALFASVLIVLQGTRGPILLLGIFWFLCYFKKKGINRELILFPAALIFLYIFFLSNIAQTLLVNISLQIKSFGFSSRIIDMLISNNLSSDNGRNFITSRLLDALSNRPFIGYGLFGDRVLTKGLFDPFNFYSLGNEGTYAHNFFLEIFVDFGFFAGSILSLLLLFALINAFKRTSKTNFVFLVLFVTGFLKLFISDSYLQSPEFFALLGLLVNCSFPSRVKMSK